MPLHGELRSEGLTFSRLPGLAFIGIVKREERGGGEGERKKINFKRPWVSITAFDILTVKWKTLNRSQVLMSEAGSAP